MYVRPKKHLGQHFLKDKTIAQKIVESMQAPTNKALEVGPGTGVLTEFLVQRENLDLSLIEIDTESIKYLIQHYPYIAYKIHEGDFLKADLKTFFKNEQFSIIGNFPYNISSQIFFKVIDNKELVPEVVGMVQKEVAERMASKHGNKTYGILSVLLQRWYNIEYMFTVHENVFMPPPKVKSAVVRLTRNDRTSMNCNEALFIKVVKATFNQRRKVIRNSLRALFPDVDIDHPYMSLRPEQLSIEQFVELTQHVNKGIQ